MAKIKVSQKTVDDIKKLGMAKALKLAGQNAGATQAGAVAEQQEAIRRLYGARRVNEAAAAYNKTNPVKKVAPKKPTDSRFSSTTTKSATPAKKAAPVKKATVPAKKQSDFEKTISGAKRVLNSSPGADIKAGLKKAFNPPKNTSTTAQRRKAATDAVKRAGGRTI